MKYPDFLKRGDIIGVTALSAGVGEDIEEFERSIEKLKEKGFQILETDHVRTHGVVSSTGEVRYRELEALMLHPEVKLVLSAKGGDFLHDMLPYVDWNKMSLYPKWIQGYSDNTGILFPYTINCDVASIYGPNAGGFDMVTLHKSLEDNTNFWQGRWEKQTSFEKFQKGFVDSSKGYQLDEPVHWECINGPVDVTGRLIGGCLDVLQFLVGTPYANVSKFLDKYKEDGFIWYFDIFALKSEDCIHAFWQMKEAGWFEYARGMMIGRVCFPNTFMELSYQEALRRAFGTTLPMIFNADVGHVKPQMTMINGAMARVFSENGKGFIEQWMK